MKNKQIKLSSIAMLLCFGIVAIITSCHKDSQLPQSNPDINAKQIDIQPMTPSDYVTLSELSEMDFETKRAVYSNLSATNQVDLWQEKLSVLASLETNEEESNAISSLATLVTEDLILNNDLSEVESWMVNNSDILLPEQIESILTTLFLPDPNYDLYPYKKGPVVVPGGGGGIGPHNPSPLPDPTQLQCSCSQVSDWCGSGTNCDPTNCEVPGSKGCGTLWQYNCEGRCKS